MAPEERPWLDTLDDAGRQAVAGVARRRSFPPRGIVLEEGTTSGVVVVVVSGRVRITTLSTDGRETTLAVVGPGEVIGELSAVDGRPHSATATAVDQVEALVIGSADFLRAVEEHGRLGLGLLRLVVSRLRTSDRARVEFGGRDVLQRVCSLLVELARDDGEAVEGGVRIASALSQEELATWLGASREAVNRALGQLRDLGLVETGRRRLVVRDPRRLQRLAER